MPRHPLIAVRDQIQSEEGISRDDKYKDEIVDLFRDYKHPWDILTELIQNSVDAVNDSEKNTGEINIFIDSTSNRLVIKDNGVGVSHNNIEKILVPNFSHNKSSSRTYGYKGVGLSFVSHLTKKFKIESVHDGMKASCTVENNIDWVLGDPDVEIHKTTSEPVSTDEEAGTMVSVTLDGDYSRVRTLRSLNDFFAWASIYRVIEFVIRTKTAAGNTKKFFGRGPRKEIDIKVKIDDGPEENIPFFYLSPFASDYSSGSRYLLKREIDSKKAYEDIYTDSTKRDKDKVYRCLRHDINDLQVGQQERTRTDFDLSVHVCGESGLTELEKEFGVRDLDKSILNSFKADTGIYLSIDGMPTSIQLHNYTGGFKKRFFCLVDLDIGANDELNKGRTEISEHTKNLIVSKIDEKLKEKIVDERYSIYQAARRMKEPRSRGYAGADVMKHLEKWDKTPHVIDDLSLRKEPLDENALISIFFELLGQRKIRGYNFRYVSQDATFDFVFEHKVYESRLDEHSYSISRGFVDNLGYNIEERDGLIMGKLGQDWHVGEFKISVEDIVGKDNQPLENLDLLVAWDYDQDKIISSGANLSDATVDNRSFEGVTHILSDRTGECQVLCIKDLMGELGMLIDVD